MPRPKRQQSLISRARDLPPIIRRGDLAALFDVHPSTIQRDADQGSGRFPPPMPRVSGQWYRWLREDVIAWLQHPDVRQRPTRPARPLALADRKRPA